MLVAYDLGMSYPQIGKHILTGDEKMDHTSVHHGVRSAHLLIRQDASYRERVNNVRSAFGLETL